MAKQRKTQTIPIVTATRMLNRSGANRVSKEAAKEFAGKVEEIAIEIAEKAVRVAKHSGRRTVLESDIKFAMK